MAMLQKQPTSGFGNPPRTWHWNWWLEFRRIVEGPVSSGILGGPVMFFITLIDVKMIVTNKIIWGWGQTQCFLGIPSLLNRMVMKTGMRTNSLWTATVTVSVADPALLLAVQETCNNNLETGTIIQYCKDYGLHHLKLLNSLRNGDQQGVLEVHGGWGLSSECDLKSFPVLGNI